MLEFGDIVSVRFNQAATAEDKKAVLRVLGQDFEHRAQHVDPETAVRLWAAASAVRNAEAALVGSGAAGGQFAFRSLNDAASRLLAQRSLLSMMSAAGCRELKSMAASTGALTLRHLPQNK